MDLWPRTLRPAPKSLVALVRLSFNPPYILTYGALYRDVRQAKLPGRQVRALGSMDGPTLGYVLRMVALRLQGRGNLVDPQVRLGRAVASEIDAANMFANLVYRG